MSATSSWSALPSRVRARIRAVILARDPECRLAYPGVCTLTSTVVDHIRDRDTYGDGPDNTQGACAPCNNRKGDPRRAQVDPATPSPKGAWW